MTQLNDLTSKLEQITADLKNSYRELGTLQATEVKNRAHAWLNSGDPTVNGRRDYSAHMTADTKSEILELQGDIAALEREWDLIALKVDLLARGLV